MTRETLVLVYDGECPACHAYCQVVTINKTVGELQLIDARENSDVMQEITSSGLDIDQGMVLKMGRQLYYGADAVHALALISSRSGLINRLNYHIFKSKNVSVFLYPILRFFRIVLLKVLGKTKINNLKIRDNTKF